MKLPDCVVRSSRIDLKRSHRLHRYSTSIFDFDVRHIETSFFIPFSLRNFEVQKTQPPFQFEPSRNDLPVTETKHRELRPQSLSVDSGQLGNLLENKSSSLTKQPHKAASQTNGSQQWRAHRHIRLNSNERSKVLAKLTSRSTARAHRRSHRRLPVYCSISPPHSADPKEFNQRTRFMKPPNNADCNEATSKIAFAV